MIRLSLGRSKLLWCGMLIALLLAGGAITLSFFGRWRTGEKLPEAGASSNRVAVPQEAAGAWKAISPDGKTLATWATKVCLWDLATGKLLAVDDPGPGGDPRCGWHFCFSPNCRRLAAVGQHALMGEGTFKTIYVWEVTADRQLGKHQMFKTTSWGWWWPLVGHVSLSPDGKELAAGSSEGIIRVWDLDSGKERLQFPGGVAANFSSDGKTLASVNYAGVVRRWDAATGKPLDAGVPKPDFIYVQNVAFSPDGRLTALSDSYRVCVKDTATGRTVRSFDLATTPAPPVFLTDNKTLAVVVENGLRLLDVTSGADLGWVPSKSGTNSYHGNGWLSPPDAKHLIRFDGTSLVIEEVPALLANKEQPPVPADAKPLDGTLVAELIAHEDTYVLQRLVQDGDSWLPPRPTVDLEFRLRNTGKQAIAIEEIAFPDFYLQGDGAFNHELWPLATGVGNVESKARIIKPGQTYSIPITDLGMSNNVPYWLSPGEYALHARWHGKVLPAPKGSEVNEEGFGSVTLYPTVKLRVVPSRVLATLPPDDPLGILPGLQPEPDKDIANIRTKLSKPVNLDKGIEANSPLKDALAFLADRYDLEIAINEKAFKKASEGRIDEAKIGLPPLVGVSMSAVLHCLLDQVDADIEITKDHIGIVPVAKPRSLVERLRPANRRLREKLNQNVSLPKPIDRGTPLAQALTAFADLNDLVILIDKMAFKRARINDIDKRPVELFKVGSLPISVALQELLNPVGATFVAVEDFLLVIPGEEVKSLPAELFNRDQPRLHNLFTWNDQIVARTDRFLSIDVKKGAAAPLKIPKIKRIIDLATRGEGQALALGRNDDGIVLLAKDRGDWTPLPLPDGVRKSTDDFSLYADESSLVLIAGERCFRHAGGVWKPVPVKPRPLMDFNNRPKIPCCRLLAGTTLYEGYNWGEWGGDLLTLNLLTGEWTRPTRRDSDHWIPVHDIRIGPDNVVWAAGGLLHLGRQQGSIYNFDGKRWRVFAATSNHFGRDEKTINWPFVPTSMDAVAFDEKGLLYILTQDLGVVRHDGEKWTQFTKGWPGCCVMGLQLAADGLLVIGTYDAGILLWDPNTQAMRRVNLQRE